MRREQGRSGNTVKQSKREKKKMDRLDFKRRLRKKRKIMTKKWKKIQGKRR